MFDVTKLLKKKYFTTYKVIQCLVYKNLNKGNKFIEYKESIFEKVYLYL